jgi:hypothetical protein
MKKYIHSHRFVSRLIYRVYRILNNDNINFGIRIGALAVCLCFAFKGIAQQNKLGIVNTLTSTPFVNDGPPAFSVNQTNSGLTSTIPLVLTGWENPANVLSSITSNYATANVTVSGSVWLKVADISPGERYHAGNFAGFVVEKSGLLGVGESITINTYLNGGSPLDTKTFTSLLGTGLTGNMYEVGLYATKEFNQIEIKFGAGLAVTSLKVYHAVMRGYTASTALINCSNPANLSLPTYPAVVNPDRTSSSISNPNNAVTALTSDFASFPVLTLFSPPISFAVRDQVKDYNTNQQSSYFVGFDIQSDNLLDLSLLGSGGYTIETYKNDTLQDRSTNSGNQLLAVGLLSSVRQKIGFVTKKPFDEIVLIQGAAVVAAKATNIYNAVIEEYCAGPALVCNTPTPIVRSASNPFPVVVDPANTGFTGLVTVGTISNTGDAIDNDLTNSANITFTAGLLATANFAIKDVITDYDARTFAGFDIENSSLVELSLLSKYKLTTYRDGIKVDSSDATGNSLLSIGLATGGRQTIGFVSKAAFDEVKLTINQGLDVNLGTTKIYSAIFENFCARNLPLDCNTPTPIVKSAVDPFPVVVDAAHTGFGGLLNIGTISNPENGVDADLNNSTDITFIVSALATASYAVKDVITNYDSGTFVGFDIENTSLADIALLNNVKITTFLDGVEAENSNAGGQSLLSVGLFANGRQTIGIVAKKPFDEVKITITKGVDINLGVIKIYSAIIQKYCARSVELDCNTPTPVVKSVVNPFPVIIDATHTGFGGALNLGTIVNAGDAIDASLANYAAINFNIGALATANFAVKDLATIYPAGTYAGFDVAFPTLLGANLVGSYSISTFLGGVRVDTVVYSDLAAVPTTLLSANGRKKIGIVATAPFDEVKVTFSNVVSASLGTVQIFSAIFEKFCNPPALDCNTKTLVHNGVDGFPVYVSADNSGPTLACVGCMVSNTDNVIDNDASTYASMNVLVAAAGAGASLSVVNPLTEYPVGTYVGFDIENQYLLGTNVFSGITISTYRNGNPVVVESKSGSNALISVSSSLLTESGRHTLGFVTSAICDEVRITLSGLAAAQITNPTKVYGVIIQKNCAPTISCNNTYWLNSGSGANSFPAVIDGSLTGFRGLACVGCAVENQDNAVSPSTSDFATIKVLIGAAAAGSLAVKDAVSTYPVGTFAGFAIKVNTGVIDVDLFKSLTISTFKNGVLREAKSANNLLDLKVLIPLLGGGAGSRNIGFVTSFDFDEIRISVSSLVGVNVIDNVVDVYGAFIDTRTSAGDGSGTDLNCAFVLNPDFNVGFVNLPLAGNVSTNDKVSVAPSYGTPGPDAGNIAGAVISMNANGTYNFSATTAGVYKYTVPVCFGSITDNCPTVPLVITVNNPAVNNNPPVANADVVSMSRSSANVVAKTLANDACSNAGCTLNPVVTVSTQPLHGVAVVNNANGDITYTPEADFVGIDSLTYTVCDNQSPTPKCATAKQYFTVLPTSAANTTSAGDDFIIVAANTSAVGDVKTNDNDPQGHLQTITQQNITVNGKGTLVLQSNGTYQFTPVSGYYGPVEFPYTTCDNGTPVACASATLHILVAEMAPRAEADHIGTVMNQAVSGNLKTNDSDPQGNSLVYNVSPTVLPLHGSLSAINPTTGQFVYIPADGYTGVDSFQYTVCNSAAFCSSAWAYVSVVPPYHPGGINNPPIAQNDLSETFTNRPVVGNARNNDIEPERSPLVYSIVNNPQHGALVLNADGTYTYTPGTDYNGADVAKYQVCDTSGACTTALIEFIVRPDVNGAAPDAPFAADDVLSTHVNVNVSGNVLLNDSYPTTGTVTVAALSTPSVGNLQLSANGSFIYIPDAGFVGTVSVPYSVCTNNGLCDVATLTIVVQKVLASDLVPIITVIPTVTNGITPFTAIVNVYEVNGVANSPTEPVRIYIAKNAIVSFVFEPELTSLNSTTVQNSFWTMNNSDLVYYIFTSKGPIAASGKSTIGLKGTITPNAGTGKLNITETIFGGSGGEIKTDNNFNAGTITFFP